MNGLDLFSGIGGISEALSPWVRTVAYCEREPKSIAILLSRVGRGEIDNAPVWDDVFTLTKSQIDCPIDIISGGFPCTDISLAGLRKGLDSDRSGLFWEVVRLTKEIRPKIVFLENVWPGVRKFVPTIRAQFENMGYSVRDGFITASDVGAPHKRSRWFLVAYADKAKLRQQSGGRKKSGQNEAFTNLPLGEGQNADTKKERHERQRRSSGDETKASKLTSFVERDLWDEVAHELCRMDNGLPLRSYARGALGDSVVPQQARAAFEIMTGLDASTGQ